MFESPNYEAEIKSALLAFFAFFLLSMLSPAFPFLGIFKPDSQQFNLWFQRSGAPMVVFALLAQMKATEVFNILNPTVMVDVSFSEIERRYRVYPKLCNVISLVLTAIGTIIWGYGDLMVGA